MNTVAPSPASIAMPAAASDLSHGRVSDRVWGHSAIQVCALLGYVLVVEELVCPLVVVLVMVVCPKAVVCLDTKEGDRLAIQKHNADNFIPTL